MMDSRAFARAHDSYLDPDRYYGFQELPPQPQCSRCGAFLKFKADRVENKEDVLECDGTVTLHPQEYDEALIDILGEEYRGKTYDVAVSACGIDVAPHAPHSEVQWAWGEEHRTCKRCGYDDVRAD